MREAVAVSPGARNTFLFRVREPRLSLAAGTDVRTAPLYFTLERSASNSSILPSWK